MSHHYVIEKSNHDENIYYVSYWENYESSGRSPTIHNWKNTFSTVEDAKTTIENFLKPMEIVYEGDI